MKCVSAILKRMSKRLASTVVAPKERETCNRIYRLFEVIGSKDKPVDKIVVLYIRAAKFVLAFNY